MNKNNLEACIKLYRDVFGDSKKLTKHVFYNEKNLITYKFEKIEEHITSVAFCRRKMLSINDKVQEIPFLFGIATDAKYRHQGRSSKVINSLLQELKEKGYPFALLCPANEGLYKFYEQFGFKKFNYCSSVPAKYLIKNDTIMCQTDVQDAKICQSIYLEYNKQFEIFQYRSVEDMKNKILEATIDSAKIYLLKKDNETYGYMIVNQEGKIEEIISLYFEKHDVSKCFDIDIDQEVIIQKLLENSRPKEVIKVLNEKDFNEMETNSIAFYDEW